MWRPPASAAGSRVSTLKLIQYGCGSDVVPSSSKVHSHTDIPHHCPQTQTQIVLLDTTGKSVFPRGDYRTIESSSASPIPSRREVVPLGALFIFVQSSAGMRSPPPHHSQGHDNNYPASMGASRLPS
ncbi:hypothetical protein EI94DRAFT_1755404, partial [Lactarius quietus]